MDHFVNMRVWPDRTVLWKISGGRLEEGKRMRVHNSNPQYFTSVISTVRKWLRHDT